MQTLIRNADYLVTLDEGRRIIEDGAVTITDGRITAVGKTSDLAANVRFDKTIDARGKLVMPGLVDTHVHCAQQLGRSLASEAYSMERWGILWGFEKEMTPEDATCGFRLCMAEMLRAGITCFADPGNYFPYEQAQVVKESGIRGLMARTAVDVGKTPMGQGRFGETTEEAFTRSEQAVKDLDGTADGRVKMWFSMRIPMTLSDELLRRMAKSAEQHGVGMIGHACENREEVMASHSKFGAGDVLRLERLGILNSKMLMIHMGWLSSEEMMLVKSRDVKVSLGPSPSFHQAQGNIFQGKAPELRALGATLSLGCDSAMSSNFMDVLRNASLLVGGYAESRLDPRAITAEDAVEMATLGGARATLWGEETGSLEQGKKADIAILNVMRPEWQPIHNPISNLVHCANAGCVETVLVDGKVVVEGGKVLTLNESDLYEEAQDRALSIARRAKLDMKNRPLWPVS